MQWLEVRAQWEGRLQGSSCSPKVDCPPKMEDTIQGERNIYMHNERMKIINQSKTMKWGEDIRGQKTLISSPKKKKRVWLSNWLNGFCSLIKLSERKNIMPLRTWCDRWGKMSPCREGRKGGTKPSGKWRDKDCGDRKKQIDKREWTKIRFLGQGLKNSGDGMGSSGGVCGERGPVKPGAVERWGFLSHLPKTPWGALEGKSKYLPNLVLLFTFQSPAPRTISGILWALKT